MMLEYMSVSVYLFSIEPLNHAIYISVYIFSVNRVDPCCMFVLMPSVYAPEQFI